MYFHFHSDDKHIDKKLVTNRCEHLKANNQLCKNKITIGQKLCHIHRLIELHLKVKKSNIPNAGKGLFCKDPTKGANDIIFRKGDKICNYNGELITEVELNNRYGDDTAPYAIELHRKRYSDGAIVRGVGTLLNHSTKAKSNVRFSIKQDNSDITIVAIKNIKNGAELLINYGRAYKFNEPGVISYTGANEKDYTHLY